MYRKTTHNITVSVKPHYLEDETFPEENRYVWAYHIRVENHGNLKIRRTDICRLNGFFRGD
ncbi:MAG: ApaG domain [Alphaproteobacteria bacterium]|nr:ApaG domain [Alphaproteobacteria bacterium]